MCTFLFKRVARLLNIVPAPNLRRRLRCRCRCHRRPSRCCRFSIHNTQRQPGELRAAQQSFPIPVPGCPGVFHCGFAAEASFGATSYFIRRPEVGPGAGS